MALFGAVRRVFAIQHTEMLLVFVVVVATALLVAFLLSGRFLRYIVLDWFVQCGLQMLAEILKVSQGSSRRFKFLNLHLPLPLDWNFKL